MLQNSIRIFLFLFLITCVVSCKKDSDEFGPIVTIDTPYENQPFNVNDVIQVKASVSDATKITEVAVSLVDEQLNVAHVSIAVSVSSPSMNINTLYPLDNIHLESGTYYLLITASDGKNVSHMYRKIYITAIPKVIKKIYVTSYNSASVISLSYIDSAFSGITPFHNFSGDHIGSSVSSYYQQAYMCGNYTGSFTGIKLPDNSIKFSISPVVSFSPYFTGLYSNDKDNYVAYYDGFIRGYNFEGSPLYNAMAESGFYAQHMCFNNGYMIAEEKDKISSTKRLVTYYPTGSGQQSCILNQDLVAFCEKDYANVFLFGNSSGQGVIQLFDRLNNNIWTPYSSLATGIILSAVKIDPNTYLIGHSNGIIYKYEYQTSSVTTYLTGYAAVQLKYDIEADRLYVAEANRISRIDYSSASLVNSVNSAETVLDINLLYNR